MGYQIRFEKTVNKDTKILFLTEGLLLRQVSILYIIKKYIDIIFSYKLIETIIIYLGLRGGFIITI